MIERSTVGQALVRRALADLPGHQRALLILVCVDGMSYKETAELLDISTGAVAASVARAREALDEQIALRFRPRAGGSKNSLEPACAEAEGGGHS